MYNICCQLVGKINWNCFKPEIGFGKSEKFLGLILPFSPAKCQSASLQGTNPKLPTVPFVVVGVCVWGWRGAWGCV